MQGSNVTDGRTHTSTDGYTECDRDIDRADGIITVITALPRTTDLKPRCIMKIRALSVHNASLPCIIDIFN